MKIKKDVIPEYKDLLRFYRLLPAEKRKLFIMWLKSLEKIHS